MMNDYQIVEYARRIIMSNLTYWGLTTEIAEIMADSSNKVILAHIKGLNELFDKAREILEKEIEENGKL